MLILRPMEADELHGYLAAQIEAVAQENAESYQVELDRARQDAHRDLTELLVDGLETEGHFLYVVEQSGDTGRTPVGRVWFSIDGSGGFAWLESIEIDQPFQGQGLGGEVLALAEEELTRHGIRSISLHVAAANEAAYRFYQRNGFHTTAYNMDRNWNADDASPETSVNLRPATEQEVEEILEHEIRSLAASYEQVFGLAHEQAGQMAAGQVRARLPDGMETDRHVLYVIEGDGQSRKPLGHIWFSRGRNDETAWLQSFALYASTPGRALAEQVFALVEGELSREGIRSMKLYLVGDDLDIRDLYQHLGFRIGGRHMARRW